MFHKSVQDSRFFPFCVTRIHSLSHFQDEGQVLGRDEEKDGSSCNHHSRPDLRNDLKPIQQNLHWFYKLKLILQVETDSTSWNWFYKLKQILQVETDSTIWN
jgi:hypothetical protein